MRLSCAAPLKLNLFLHVIGKRADGYHDIESLMVCLDYGDRLSLSKNKHNAPSLSITGEFKDALTSQRDENLVMQAMTLMARDTHFHVDLEKHIPLGAGLGGGSSDAAATIRLLKNALGCDLIPFAPQIIGADVPFCLHGAPAFVRGLGEIVTPCFHSLPYHAVVIYPDCALSTKNIFARITDISPPTQMPKGNNDHIVSWLAQQKNDLQKIAIGEFPVIERVLDELAQDGHCLLHRMSGSGSSCFGLFARADEARHCAEKIARTHPSWWVRHAPILETLPPIYSHF